MFPHPSGLELPSDPDHQQQLRLQLDLYDKQLNGEEISGKTFLQITYCISILESLFDKKQINSWEEAEKIQELPLTFNRTIFDVAFAQIDDFVLRRKGLPPIPRE